MRPLRLDVAPRNGFCFKWILGEQSAFDGIVEDRAGDAASLPHRGFSERRPLWLASLFIHLALAALREQVVAKILGVARRDLPQSSLGAKEFEQRSLRLSLAMLRAVFHNALALRDVVSNKGTEQRVRRRLDQFQFGEPSTVFVVESAKPKFRLFVDIVAQSLCLEQSFDVSPNVAGMVETDLAEP